ncbi:MAG: flagellar basal body P-ring formation protein FlgA [Marinosulfonomonas sp.]|nr:flagellar basal body P-ring formation protein FlgA [Marinosulfonomonas sp.]
MFSLCASAGFGETLVATRTIRSHAIIGPGDVILKDVDIAGSLDRIEDAVGLEARVVLYAGRPVRPGDVGPAAIIKRNQIVMLVYRRGGLRIAADARALGRGGVGDYLRVMNLTSRTTVTGIIGADGTVTVGR